METNLPLKLTYTILNMTLCSTKAWITYMALETRHLLLLIFFSWKNYLRWEPYVSVLVNFNSKKTSLFFPRGKATKKAWQPAHKFGQLLWTVHLNIFAILAKFEVAKISVSAGETSWLLTFILIASYFPFHCSLNCLLPPCIMEVTLCWCIKFSEVWMLYVAI